VTGPLGSVTTIPEFAWELFLGVCCTIWGFRPSSPILRADDQGATMPASASA
jgi:hypothetical protein